MYKNLLIALEGKPSDAAAVEHGLALARQVGARLTLLRVITVAADGPGGLGKQFQTEPGSNGWKHKNQAAAMLEQLDRRLNHTGLEYKTAIVIGDRSEADEIVAYAEDGDFDLVVMAADGRSAWKRALFGAPAEAVQRKASMPTLFVSDGSRRQPVARREAVQVNQTMAAFGSAGL